MPLTLIRIRTPKDKDKDNDNDKDKAWGLRMQLIPLADGKITQDHSAVLRAQLIPLALSLALSERGPQGPAHPIGPILILIRARSSGPSSSHWHYP